MIQDRLRPEHLVSCELHRLLRSHAPIHTEAIKLFEKMQPPVRSIFSIGILVGCLSALLLGSFSRGLAQTTVFSCSSFSASGSCGVGSGQNFRPNGTATLTSPRLTLIPNNETHVDASVWWYTPVNVQRFTSTFTFVPNGQNVAFVVQNNVGSNGNGLAFNSGAGCEAGFYQAFGAGPLPNNLLALELDSYSPLTLTGSFTYSSTQAYQANQSPCLPNDNGPNYTPTNKLSTYPVNLTTGSQNTSTGDTYSVTVTYDGSNLTMSMYDVTRGGSCPGTNCYSHTWSENIPALVGSSTAYVGFTGATGLVSRYPLYIDSFSYTEGSTTQAATPQLSPFGGTYTSPQSVTISDATPGATIHYTTNGGGPSASSPTYTGPLTVSATETLRAMAVAPGDANSGIVTGYYTVGAPPSGGASSTVINYPSGFAAQPSEIWLQNSAVYSGSSIKLTGAAGGQANNAWYKTPVNVKGFTTTFSWNAVCPAKPALCGDGMGFMIISSANPSSAGYNYSGYSGQDFSWSRCSGGTSCQSIKSVLVKLDMYNNASSTDGANLTGLYLNGVLPQSPQAVFDMSPSGISMQSGHLMKATLTYNGTVLMQSVTDTVTGATYRNSYSVDIPSIVGGNTALVGFGGSSGGAYVTQNIQDWTYTVQ